MAQTAGRGPTERFSDRVENYVRYRPGYPEAVLDQLELELGMNADWVVADIGCGPGNLARMFLDRGLRVFGVEPNDPMREAGERQLDGYPKFASVAGTAEATGLASSSVDLVTAGQAFHWFDSVRAREEFQRILRPGGALALVWNSRSEDASPCMAAYEKLLRETAKEYADANHRNLTDSNLAEMFAPEPMSIGVYIHVMACDWDGFLGAALSASYVPQDDPAFVTALRAVFDEHQVNDQVEFVYETRVYFGRMGRSSEERSRNQ